MEEEEIKMPTKRQREKSEGERREEAKRMESEGNLKNG